jgi:hypothetical protein
MKDRSAKKLELEKARTAKKDEKRLIKARELFRKKEESELKRKAIDAEIKAARIRYDEAYKMKENGNTLKMIANYYGVSVSRAQQLVGRGRWRAMVSDMTEEKRRRLLEIKKSTLKETVFLPGDLPIERVTAGNIMDMKRAALELEQEARRLKNGEA